MASISRLAASSCQTDFGFPLYCFATFMSVANANTEAHVVVSWDTVSGLFVNHTYCYDTL